MAQVFTTPETKEFLNSLHHEMIGRIMPEIAKGNVAVFRPDDLMNLLSESERVEFNGRLSADRQVSFANRLLGVLPGGNSVESLWDLFPAACGVE